MAEKNIPHKATQIKSMNAKQLQILLAMTIVYTLFENVHLLPHDVGHIDKNCSQWHSKLGIQTTKAAAINRCLSQIIIIIF